tara:strand:- start:1652 stop:2173 length:522 start_codon:yes stop_codon:yes gene_type:complete
MKKNFLYIILSSLFIFIFVIFYIGIYKSSNYKPTKITNNKLIEFSSKKLFFENKINIKDLISKKNYTLINIWASWCTPCKSEHVNLMRLAKFKNLTVVGLNYKDKPQNAKKFIQDLGNPFNEILTDPDGTISIGLGAYGIPESFLVNKDSKIIKKYIGQLTLKQVSEIEKIIN